MKQHSADPSMLRLIPVLDKIVQNGVYLDTSTPNKANRNKRDNTKYFHYYGAKLDNGTYVRFVVREMNNGAYYYDGEATREEILKGASETASSIPNGVQASSAPLARHSLAYYFAESERMSKLLDENGEPLQKHIDQSGSEVPRRTGGSPLTQRDVARALEQLGYHGSPYHFDRFTLSHIGSGEGAQAHGWGLYFALSRRTAEGYRKRLAGASTYTYNGKSLHELHDELYKESQAERKKPNSPDKLAKLDLLTSKMLLLTSFIIGGKDAAKVEKTAPKRYQDAYKWLTEEVYPNLKLEKGGKVYTVEIPDDDVMLREEKKISEQSEFIQNAVRKATADMKIKQDAEEVEDFLDGLEKYDLVDMPKTFEKIQQMFSNNDERLSSDVSIAQALKDTVHQDAVALYEWNKEDNDANDITVEEIESNCQNTLKECLAEITRMARKNGNVDIGGLTGREVYSLLNHEFLSARSTSLYLNKFGIKGMRYEGARDGECAVVWDEESIKILNALEQSMQSGPRGTYMPQNTSDTNSMSGVMTLMQTRDKSTFLHESAHVRLDADTMLPKGIADIVFARRDSNQSGTERE